jgi:hypothetical protein
MFNPVPKPIKTAKKKRYYIKPGAKTNEWEAAKKVLKPAFAEVGLTFCEVGKYLLQNPDYEAIMLQHRHYFFLTWAHGDKRDNLVGDELLTLVVLSCVDCHNYIEKLPREEMRAIVESIISHRQTQPSTYHE